MTAPVDITELVPSKAKTWVGLFGSVVTFVAPLALSVSDALPSPWPAVIGAVLAVLTALGIYKAPYKPSSDAVLVPQAAVADDPYFPPATPNNPLPGEHQNPWA